MARARPAAASPPLGGERLLALLLVFSQGLGVAAVHNWSPAVVVQSGRQAALPPPPDVLRDVRTAPPQHLETEFVDVLPSALPPADEDLDALPPVLPSPEDVATDPEPGSAALGVVDFFGDAVKVTKSRLQSLVASAAQVSLPWWGWLIVALVLVLLTVAAFLVGALFSWHFIQSRKAESGEKPTLTESIKAAARGAFTSSSAKKGSSKDSNEGSPQESPRLPALDDWASRAVAGQVAARQAFKNRCLPCLPHQCSDLFTEAVKRAIAVIDKKVIGVALHIGRLRVSATSGTVEVEDLVLDNPEGYFCEFLLRIRKMELQVSMSKYIFSRGKTVVVESLAVANVEVNYEQALTTSNLEYVLKFTKKAKKAFQRGMGHEDVSDTDDEQTTVTGSILGAITATGTAAASQLGGAVEAVAGAAGADVAVPSAVTWAQHAKDTWESAAQSSAVGRIANRAGKTVVGTVGDFGGHAANIVGAGVFAGTALAVGTAQAVERKTLGAVTGAVSSGANMAQSGLEALSDVAGSVGATVGLAGIEEEKPEEEAKDDGPPMTKQESLKSAKPKVAFIIKKLAISNIYVTLASRLVGGRGLTLPCGDISYENFTTTVKSTMGLDIVRFLLKATLLSAVKSLSGIHEMTLDAGHRVLDLGRTVAEEVQAGATKAIHLV